jgi:4-hydroxy-tetrahydrodipicolinate synthase
MLKHEDASGLAKLTRIREREEARPQARLDPGGQWRALLSAGAAPRRRRCHDGLCLAGNAGRGLLTAGKVEEAEDLFDIYLPLVRHEVQPGIGLALRKEVLFRRGAIKSPKQRAPGSSLTATDRTELDSLIARLERRLADAGRGRKAAE